jgi:regulator of protease activity HflC (stomatin/prohibitin superfamily)
MNFILGPARHYIQKLTRNTYGYNAYTLNEQKGHVKMFRDRQGNVQFRSGGVVGLIILALIVLWLVSSSIYTVPAGFVGVVTRFGAVQRVVQPGLGTKIPFIEDVIRMDVRTQKDQTDVTAASSDLQQVTSTIAVNYNLDPQYAAQVYQTVGTSYQDILIAPAIQNIFKATTAKFTAEQLITSRESVRTQAESALKQQLVQYHIIVLNFNIVNFDFSKQFDDAIEQKQVAEQQVETAKQQLAKAQVDAQTAVAQAQGQADAQKALKDAGSLTPEYLEFLAIQKWDGHLPSVIAGGTTPFIDLSQFSNSAGQPPTH